MSELRTRLIRLAAAKPELRADLLPLLKEDADPASVDQNKPESYYGLPPKGVQASTNLSRASIQSLARNKGLSITTKRLKALGLDFDRDFGKPGTPLYSNWRNYQLDWIRLNALSQPNLPQGLKALQRHLPFFNESERALFDAANQLASGRGIQASTRRRA